MWCRSSLSGRADALYVVNDVLGSFLLRANEVIDQVPMSACGAPLRHADRCRRCLFIGEERKLRTACPRDQADRNEPDHALQMGAYERDGSLGRAQSLNLRRPCPPLLGFRFKGQVNQEARAHEM
jgi:hypothetical protein